jgi:hypothetical protein
MMKLAAFWQQMLQLASTTINLRIAAVRRLAYEAADCEGGGIMLLFEGDPVPGDYGLVES